MYKKITLSVFVLIFTFSLNAQQEILNYKISDDARIDESFSFANAKNRDIAIVTTDDDTVYATLFDSEFKQKSTLTLEPFRQRYDEILGHIIQGEKYTILASNGKRSKFAVMVLDFVSKKGSIKEIDIDFGKEEFVETVANNNRLFLITATKDNDFVLREFTEKNTLKTLKTFKIDFSERDQKLLRRKSLFSKLSSNFTKIDNRVPNAIEQVAENNKLYQKENQIYLTIEDEDEEATILHIIDLEGLTLSSTLYEYPIGKKDDFKKYNSFILANKILQLGSSNDEMKITIKNFDGSLVKEFYLERDKPIDIKNSPIIQQGQTAVPFVNRREIEETSKYLRKISSGDIGITAYDNEGEYAVTVGGYKIVQSGGGFGAGGGFGVGGLGGGAGVGVPVYSYNPTYYSFAGFSNSKSTYFNTTLNKEFEYVKKEEKANVFEKIKVLKKELKGDAAENVFIHDGSLYYGYFSKDDKNYRLLKM